RRPGPATGSSAPSPRPWPAASAAPAVRRRRRRARSSTSARGWRSWRNAWTSPSACCCGSGRRASWGREASDDRPAGGAAPDSGPAVRSQSAVHEPRTGPRHDRAGFADRGNDRAVAPRARARRPVGGTRNLGHLAAERGRAAAPAAGRGGRHAATGGRARGACGFRRAPARSRAGRTGAATAGWPMMSQTPVPPPVPGGHVGGSGDFDVVALIAVLALLATVFALVWPLIRAFARRLDTGGHRAELLA